MYDIIIIGGGIAGLYCAQELSKKHKILLCDERNYLGGRIRTNKRPRYEIGAARFNNSHILLQKLIKQYNLPTYELNKNYDFISKTTKKITPDINLVIDNFIDIIIKRSKSFTKKQLIQMTFKEFCKLHFTSKQVSKIISYFGYTSEFEIMNAYDALRSFNVDFNGKDNYYVVVGGLYQLCNKMGDTILQQGGNISLNTHIQKVNKVSNYYEVCSNKKTLIGKKVIFAIKAHQLINFPLLKPLKTYLNSVKAIPLIRIYAKYRAGLNGVWFKDLKRTTTNSFLRHIIPINPSTGLIMISYVDGKDIKPYFNKNKLLPIETIKNKIHKEVCSLFPNKKIPKPTYFKVHLWTEGIYQWKKGVDSLKVHKKVINPIKNIYICGEGLSLNQAWIEGALDTAQKVVNKI